MIVYLPRYLGGAMKWIYEGYFNAWDAEGYKPKYYTSLAEIDTDSTYMLMTTCGACHEQKLSLTSKVLNKASKVFMYVQANKYPKPWGTHLNYITHCSPEFIQMVNSMESIKLWSFADTESVDHWDEWKTIKYLPLAFDNIGYSYELNSIFKYDVCYVGGTADNAFNEKVPIMIDYFSELQKQGISTEGLFVNRNISIEAEYDIISNSKICLNIHDKYQQVLGLDCNERTFKSLGLNGFLISDTVKCLSDFTDLNIIQVESPKEMAEQVKEYLDKDLSIIKDLNRSVILENHTYTSRVRSLMCL